MAFILLKGVLQDVSKFNINLISSTKIVDGKFELNNKPTVFDLISIAKAFRKAILSLSPDSKKLLKIELFSEEIDLDGDTFQSLCIQVIEIKENQFEMISEKFELTRQMIFDSIKSLPKTILDLLIFSNYIPAKTKVFARDHVDSQSQYFYVQNHFEETLLNESRKLTALNHLGEITVICSDFSKINLPFNRIASKLTEVSKNTTNISGHVSGMIDHHHEIFLASNSGDTVKIQMNEAYSKFRKILDHSHYEKRIIDVTAKITFEYCAGEAKPKSYEFESLKLTKNISPNQVDLDFD
jgi:hypothetical protein